MKRFENHALIWKTFIESGSKYSRLANQPSPEMAFVMQISGRDWFARQNIFRSTIRSDQEHKLVDLLFSNS